MLILGIDTSCDDTCLAVLEVKNSKLKLKSNIASSQVKLHRKYGGVFPSLAKREHQRNLPLVLKKALKTAKISLKKIEAIAITIGPGLEPCLWTGINFAKELSKKWHKPLIPINHIEAHLLANLLNLTRPKIRFPALGLVVSGGHTQLILMKKIGQCKIIGETRDDAAGECFDKTARILGLTYPGGPAISALASKDQPSKKVNLPRPMFNTKDYDFSFSGLKTAVLYNFKKQPEKMKKSREYVKMMAKEIEQAIIDVLLKKTIKAAKDFRVKTIILGGGVAANKELRKQFKIHSLKLKVDIFVPEKNLCTDNAAMVALTGYYNRKKTISSVKIKAKANLRL